MDEVKVKKTRKKRTPSLLDSLKNETATVTSSATKPVSGGEVIVVRKIGASGGSGEEHSRINPAALKTFAADNKLDYNACETCVSKGTHVNHNGFTFEKVGCL